MHLVRHILTTIITLITLVFSLQLESHASTLPIIPNHNAIEKDLEQILRVAGLSQTQIQIGSISESDQTNQISLDCSDPSNLKMNIQAIPHEWGATFYWGLHNLGFYFPHPRTQISPTLNQIQEKCGKSWTWKPRFKHRGFHLHTEHPNEWVKGFLEGDSDIALDYVRWLARNQQNIVEIVLLRTVPLNELSRNLKRPYALAHKLGIVTGISLSIEMQQQKSAHLVYPNIIGSFLFPKTSLQRKLDQIPSGILEYVKNINFDFMSVDMGTTEFTHSSYEAELQLIAAIEEHLTQYDKSFFVKTHASINQYHPTYGNFNFLPQFANPNVGVLPHTLMFYGLTDDHAPMYGRTNFSDMLNFMKSQVQRRPTWYYPETSYWVGLDQDIPLLLTDYLKTRSKDMEVTQSLGVTGHLTFTSGQGLGYWLQDWSVALFNSEDYANEPLVALRLLGENIQEWKNEADYQTEYFKKKGLISMITSASFTEELCPPLRQYLLKRKTFTQLKRDSYALHSEITLLEQAVDQLKDTQFVKNEELRLLLTITHSRVAHALALRQAIRTQSNLVEKNKYLLKAKLIRLSMQDLMQKLVTNYDHYPSANVFSDSLKNPTSYAFGYLWPAASLHFWKREESIVEDSAYGNPFFMNIYNPISILF